MLTLLIRHLRPLAASLALLTTSGLMAGAATKVETTVSDTLPDDIEPTLSGSYLSALSATTALDYNAALGFLRDALSEDPQNPQLIDRTFAILITLGRIDEAVPLARRLVEQDPGNRVADMVLGAQALKTRKFVEASKYLSVSDNGPLANVTSALLSAWAAQGQGQTDGALQIITTLQGPQWYGVFKNFNIALLDDVAGRKDAALPAISDAVKIDAQSMRVTEAYARLMARAGRVDDAKAALQAYIKAGSRHPVITSLLDEINAGKKPAPLIASATEGAAEVLYGLGAAIGGENGGADLASIYLRLAAYLNPKSDLIALQLGDLMQTAQRFDESIAIFESIPKASPLRHNADLQIALSFDAQDKHDEAIKRLNRLLAKDPHDLEALTTLGTIYRSSKRFTEAADVYSKAIAGIGTDDPRNWLVYYFRGIAYERSNQWPLAEADFLKALDISPNEPQVLNYLGYSWVDKGINLDRGMAMIRKAVDLRPNDGYIVDSLGWAYYTAGRYPEAVAQLERAVSLKSEDSTINDHLGDAYWKAGRKLEATFQWAHARDLNPEPEDKPRILDKLARGLDKVEETKVATAASNTATDATAGAAPVVKAQPTTVTVEKGDSLWKIATKFYGDGEFYSRLIEANRGKLGSNPDVIIPGLVIDLPKVDGTAAPVK